MVSELNEGEFLVRFLKRGLAWVVRCAGEYCEDSISYF